MNPYPQTPFANYPTTPQPPRRGGFSPAATIAILAGATCLVAAFLWAGFKRDKAAESEVAEAAACTEYTSDFDYAWSFWADWLVDNEAAAALSWKGNCQKVTGTVLGVDSDFRNLPVVEIGTGEGMFEVHTMRCRPEQPQAALSLTKGQKITTWGLGGDEILGSLGLEHCQWEAK